MFVSNPPPPGALRASPARTLEFPEPLKLWHLASLDAPTVAVVWAGAFGWAAHIHVPALLLVVLGLVVWSLYIGDRLLDARGGINGTGSHALQERHWFHWRHRQVLLPMGTGAALVALGMIASRLSGLAIGRDALVGLATLAYFSGVHTAGTPSRLKRAVSRLISRELIVGLIFSAGCLLPAVTSANTIPPGPAFLLIGLYFSALAWLNVHAIDCWEATAWPRRSVWVPACVAGSTGLLAALLFAGHAPRAASVLALGAVSALLLAVLDRARSRMTPLTLRIAADAVLLTPALLTPALAFSRAVSR